MKLIFLNVRHRDPALNKDFKCVRMEETEIFEKLSFYKKLLKFKQTSISCSQSHTFTDHKKLRPLKLERSHCIKRVQTDIEKVIS